MEGLYKEKAPIKNGHVIWEKRKKGLRTLCIEKNLSEYIRTPHL